MPGKSKKKKVLLAKLYGHPAEHGIPYDPKFLSLALYYLRAYALKNKKVRDSIEFEIGLFDAATPGEKILKQIYEWKPDVVAFSSYLSEFVQTVDLGRKIKYVLPDCRIIIGGPSVRFPEKFLAENPFFDAVVEGEGEIPFMEMMKAVASGGTFHNIPSVTFRHEDEIIRNGGATPRMEIDDIPIIFTREFMEGTSGIAVCETARGCENRCKFCGLGLVGMRNHSMKRIERDLTTILSRKEIRRVFIGDANFFTDRKRSFEILEIIKKYNRHKIQLEFYADFLTSDEELLSECRKAYIHDSLRIPIQTFNPDALKLSGRSWFDFDAVARGIETVQRYFPSTWGEIIIGLPGDNYEGIKDSIRWCSENGLTRLKCHRLKSLPGSEYTRHPEKYGLVADNTPPHSTYCSNTFSYDEILRAEELNRNFQLFSPFIRTYDVLNLKEIGIDITEEAEALDPFLPEWEGIFRIDDEENILETSQEAAPLLAAHIGKRHRLTKNTMAFLEELFRYRYRIASVYNFVKENVLYNPDYIESLELKEGMMPVVPAREEFSLAFDIPGYLSGDVRIKKPVKNAKRILFLYSHLINNVVPWELDEAGAMDPVFDNLEKLLDAAGAGQIDGSALDVLNNLLDKGYIFFTQYRREKSGRL